MRSRWHVWVGCVVALLVALAPARAQTAVPAGAADALRAMSQTAAVIFSGQVVGVRRGEGVVEIDFAVEDAIRGVRGGVYTLREWAGLWGAGNEPLRLGQRYLMLLHAPGAGGLSSPVGGADGGIPILGAAPRGAVGPALVGGAASADGRTVDLRWVATRASRAAVYGAEATRPASMQVAVQAMVQDTGNPMVDAVKLASNMGHPAEIGGARVDVTLAARGGAGFSGGASYAAVAGLLRDWEKADAAR
jgi:hypothetical protein